MICYVLELLEVKIWGLGLVERLKKLKNRVKMEFSGFLTRPCQVTRVAVSEAVPGGFKTSKHDTAVSGDTGARVSFWLSVFRNCFGHNF